MRGDYISTIAPHIFQRLGRRNSFPHQITFQRLLTTESKLLRNFPWIVAARHQCG
jgi:hypothetical protein